MIKVNRDLPTNRSEYEEILFSLTSVKEIRGIINYQTKVVQSLYEYNTENLNLEL